MKERFTKEASPLNGICIRQESEDLMEKTIKEARNLLRLNHRLQYQPERVVSIVCSSRSGSTISKHALCLHPELCCLAGEEEPYYKLARNGYPWHESDWFTLANDPDYIRLLIANELLNHANQHNRRVLQQQQIEEPPFVYPMRCRRRPTLVLKTPQNCYRRGVIPQLYPHAKIVYVRINRYSCAVINGLMDGWNSGQFTARKTPQGWWCFDMPPNWKWDTVFNMSVNQYRQSQKYLDAYQPADWTMDFEEFTNDWIGQCKQVWKLLGLPDFTPRQKHLPVLGATEPPKQDRWRLRRPWLEEVVHERL